MAGKALCLLVSACLVVHVVQGAPTASCGELIMNLSNNWLMTLPACVRLSCIGLAAPVHFESN